MMEPRAYPSTACLASRRFVAAHRLVRAWLIFKRETIFRRRNARPKVGFEAGLAVNKMEQFRSLARRRVS
jgi:hypothetical protein